MTDDPYKPRFSNEFQRAAHEMWIQNIRSRFGPLTRPIPADFYISNDQLDCAISAHKANELAAIFNKSNKDRRSYLSRKFPILGDLYGYLLIRDRKVDPLGVAYSKYVQKLEHYQAIIEEIEYEKTLEVERQKSEYWFSLNGFEFEKEIERLFVSQFGSESVIRTKGTGDGGIDLIISVDGSKVIVQCKAYKGPSGPHVVRDLYGVMHAEGINKGLLISLGGVTRGAKEFIEGKNISVFDVRSIIKMSEMISSGRRDR